MSKPNFKALEAYDRANRQSAEIVLENPGRYGAFMTDWAHRVLRRLEREKEEKEKRTNGTR